MKIVCLQSIFRIFGLVSMLCCISLMHLEGALAVAAEVAVEKAVDEKVPDEKVPDEKSPAKAGSTITQEMLDGMLDKYFELRKWDKETAYPYLKTLKSLDLEEIGDELIKMGIKLL